MLKHRVEFNTVSGKKSFLMAFDLAKPNHRTVHSFFANGCFYEQDISLFMIDCLRPGDCVIDIGANQGYFSLLASVLVGPEGRVVAVEPDPKNLEDIQRNLAENEFSNIAVYPNVLSDSLDEVSFYFNSDDSGGNAIWDVSQHPSNLKSKENLVQKKLVPMTLTGLMEQIDQSIRLIKIDTEGAEEMIIRGGLEAIRKRKVPYILAELHEFGLEKLGSTQSSLRGLMKELGYDTFVPGWRGGVPKYVHPNMKIRSRHLLNLVFALDPDFSALFPYDFFEAPAL